MGRSEPPEVDPDEYEARLLARWIGWSDGDMVVADAWLEGVCPDTDLVSVLTLRTAPTVRYVYRYQVWTPGTDSNPEQEAGHADINIMESSPAALLHGLQPGTTHELRPARPNAVVRRPRPPASATVTAAWPIPHDSDPDRYERCILAVFRPGPWPGIRATIEDAWLEHEYPDTILAFALHLEGLPVTRVLFRSKIWTANVRPGSKASSHASGDVSFDFYHNWYRTAGELPPQDQRLEPRPPAPEATPRRPRL